MARSLSNYAGGESSVFALDVYYVLVKVESSGETRVIGGHLQLSPVERSTRLVRSPRNMRTKASMFQGEIICT